MEAHTIPRELLRRRVRVLVVGCGGTGSAIAAGLPYLHQAMIAGGHPGGLDVTLMDGDTVAHNNCVRQPFARCEIGLDKSVVLANRLNLFWGLDWEAVPANLGPNDRIERTDIVIGLCGHASCPSSDSRGDEGRQRGFLLARSRQQLGQRPIHPRWAVESGQPAKPDSFTLRLRVVPGHCGSATG